MANVIQKSCGAQNLGGRTGLHRCVPCGHSDIKLCCVRASPVGPDFIPRRLVGADMFISSEIEACTGAPGAGLAERR